MKYHDYHFRGNVERGNGKPGYDWKEGFSMYGANGGVLYPWLTKREAQAEAKAAGAKARFFRDGVQER